jgi:hypothetical protein
MDDPVLYAYSQNIKPDEPQYKPEVVVLPKSNTEVSEVLKYANKNKIPIFICSTGMAQEAVVHRPNAIMLDLQEMNRIVEINEGARYALVEPGVTQGMLFEKTRPLGLVFAIPSAPHTTSVVTNHGPHAGTGTWPNKYGTNEVQVNGLEVVLADGRIIKTGSGAYDHDNWHFRLAIGSDLTGLFLNSLGTFGVITKASVKLHYVPEAYRTTFVHFDKIEDTTKHIDYIARKELGDYISGQDWLLCAAGSGASFPYDEFRSGEAIPEKVMEKLRKDWSHLSNFEFHITQGASDARIADARKDVLLEYLKREGITHEESEHDYDIDTGVSSWMGMRELQGRGVTTAFASKMTGFKQGFRTTFHQFIPTYLWPKVHQPMIDIAAKNGLPCGVTFKPVGPYGYTSQVRHVHWWNQNLPGERERGRKTVAEQVDYCLTQGGTIFRMAFTPDAVLKHIQPEYWELMKQLKKQLDPNSIMQPGLLGLGED